VSAKIINLRGERKRRNRAAEAERAAENRARHGRTKGERRLDESARETAERSLDGHRIETGEDGPGRE